MNLSRRLRRAEKRTEALSDKAKAVYFWDRYEATEEEDKAVLLRFLLTWVHGKPPHDDLLVAYPTEEYPNLYLWLSAVFNMRVDLAPVRPVTEPLPDEEIKRRIAFLPAYPPGLKRAR